MKQQYILSFLLVGFLLFSTMTSAQNPANAERNPEKPIVGLSIYPNPVTGNKLYITTEKSQEKQVEVYNVLGKKVLSAKLIGKELDVSDLTPGIYILRIKEGKDHATKKIVVK